MEIGWARCPAPGLGHQSAQRAGQENAGKQTAHHNADDTATLLIRGEVRGHLKRHLADFLGPTILVSHDPVDAMVLADRLGPNASRSSSVSGLARSPVPAASVLLGLACGAVSRIADIEKESWVFVAAPAAYMNPFARSFCMAFRSW